MTGTQRMHLTFDGAIATLRMDDGRANAIGPEFLSDLDRALDLAQRAGALIVWGREKVFCGGLELPTLVGFDRPRIEAFLETFDRVHERLLSFPRPIITCARGSAIAGGAILLCAGDARLATEQGKVGINEVALGLNFPTAALELVRVAVGDQRLAEVALSGRLYEGAERLRVGFVTEVVSEGAMEARAKALALDFTANDPDAVALVRHQVRRSALERVREHAVADRARFLDRWFVPETQQRLQSVVARLGRR